MHALCDEAKESLNSGLFHPTLGFQDLHIQEQMILLSANDSFLLSRISHLCVSERVHVCVCVSVCMCVVAGMGERALER